MDALSKKIEISFNANGGSPTPATQRLNREEWVKKPAEPSRSGFTFAGWYEDNNTFNKPWNFRTRVCTALTLYAKWNVVGGSGGSAVCNYCGEEPCVCILGVINAQIPVISSHPQGAAYTINTTATALGVTASVDDGGSLTYQWYSNTTNSNSGGTIINGAASASYTPSTSTLGTVYYYVVVTNTIANNGDGGNKSAAAISSAAQIIVNNFVNAQAANITTHPVSASYTINVSATALGVTAFSPDSGTLTYQWYSNTTNSNSGGNVINGATSASYTPSTSALGTRYYYVVITNTIADNGDGGVKSITTASNPAGITVIIPITTAVLTVTAPETWVTPATTASGTGNFSVSSVTWSPAHSLFRSGTQYTVNITLAASTNYTFTLTGTRTINTQNATVVSNNGSSVVLSYQFAATAALAPDMVPIPAGNFVRGGHTITLSAFRMSKFQVTQELYQAVMGTNPSSFTGNLNRPVEMVNWYHAIAFCNRLSILEGLSPAYSITGMSNTDANAWLHSNVPTSNNATWDAVTIVPGSNGYRLPTEAQWEYACRAGSTTLWHFGDDEAQLVNYAWYSANSGGTTHPVGQKDPNAWELHDMHGNVWEWCWDWWGTFPDPGNLNNPTGPASGAYRVFRGGSWYNFASNTQSADRLSTWTANRDGIFGFRLSRP
jgi:uncharacterized repeat protein (TIGR02543 family)